MDHAMPAKAASITSAIPISNAAPIGSFIRVLNVTRNMSISVGLLELAAAHLAMSEAGHYRGRDQAGKLDADRVPDTIAKVE